MRLNVEMRLLTPLEAGKRVSEGQRKSEEAGGTRNGADVAMKHLTPKTARRGSRAPTKGGRHDVTRRRREEAASAVAHPHLASRSFYGGLSVHW